MHPAALDYTSLSILYATVHDPIHHHLVDVYCETMGDDPEEKSFDRFFRHASEYLGRRVNKPEECTQEALNWALSEEISRFIHRYFYFNQNQWDRLDYFVWEKSGAPSNQPEYGKYHRGDIDLSALFLQVLHIDSTYGRT